KEIIKKYGPIKQIKFVGRIERSAVFEYYKKSWGLIFPSRLESWGVPISEYKPFNKPIVVSDLPYAKETVGKYEKVKFFNPTDSKELARILKTLILRQSVAFDETESVIYNEPCANNWEEMFGI